MARSISPRLILALLELIRHAQGRPSQVTDTQVLKILQSNSIISIDIQSREERVDILLLWVVIRIENTIGIGQDRIGLQL